MSNATLIHDFIAWGAKLTAGSRFPDVSISAEICTPTENSAAKIDFDNSKFLARVTLWSDGDFYAEAVDEATAATIISEHGHVAAGVDFGEEFSDILKLFESY
jgi:hypothetical protein